MLSILMSCGAGAARKKRSRPGGRSAHVRQERIKKRKGGTAE